MLSQKGMGIGAAYKSKTKKILESSGQWTIID
jgi:hypothetical protein